MRLFLTTYKIAIVATINFVELCSQQSAFMAGQEDIQEEIQIAKASTYRIAGNFHKPKFLENYFQWIFRKNIFEIFSYLFLLCYRLEKL